MEFSFFTLLLLCCLTLTILMVNNVIVSALVLLQLFIAVLHIGLQVGWIVNSIGIMDTYNLGFILK